MFIFSFVFLLIIENWKIKNWISKVFYFFLHKVLWWNWLEIAMETAVVVAGRWWDLVNKLKLDLLKCRKVKTTCELWGWVNAVHPPPELMPSEFDAWNSTPLSSTLRWHVAGCEPVTLLVFLAFSFSFSLQYEGWVNTNVFGYKRK